MNKLHGWKDKVRCNFIGWNYNLLSQCGEASHRLLKIYCSAVLIIMSLWFVIGTVFSQRYIGVTSLPGQLFTGAAFALIVYFIERIIILHIGGRGIYTFRTVLAVCMAILGAFIFDQMIFRNDLEEAIRRQEYVRMKKENDEKVREITGEVTLLDSKIDSLTSELVKKPFVPKRERISYGIDSLTNKPIYADNSKAVDNPIAEQIRDLAEIRKVLNEQKSDLRLVNIDDEVEHRIKNKKTGFLEELKASLNVIGESWISIVFYVILFVVLLCLELFVVSLKLFKSKKCEYDLIVEHQLDAKALQLKNQWRQISKKYITNEFDESNNIG